MDTAVKANLLGYIRAQLETAERAETDSDLEHAALALTQDAAMLVDLVQGRDHTSRGAMYRKVRKALGYTYP